VENQANPPGEPGRERVRIAFDAAEELATSCRLFAAMRGLPVSEVAREALADYLQRQKLVEVDAELENAPRKTKKQKQAVFLRATERFYFPVLAARRAKVKLSDVETWAEDPEFAMLLQNAQEYFIASFEMKAVQPIRKQKSMGKQDFLYWQSFLNAHSKDHGRFKGEVAARDYADFIDKAYKVIDEQLSAAQAKQVKDALKEMAGKRLAKMSD
jgi:hypothetical protein